MNTPINAAESMGLAVGSPAPQVVLADGDGQPIPVAQFWSAGSALLFFVRHFGCVFCHEQLAQLRNRYHEFQELGTEIVAIMPYEAERAATFARMLRLPFPVLSDQPRELFDAFGLGETSLGQLARADVLSRTVQQFLRGNIPQANPLEASIRQLGGVYIVDQSGTVRFAHTAAPVYNYPSIEVYLATLAELTAAPLARAFGAVNL